MKAQEETKRAKTPFREIEPRVEDDPLGRADSPNPPIAKPFVDTPCEATRLRSLGRMRSSARRYYGSVMCQFIL